MCLIAVAWQAHADYPLIVLANRDEFYARPAAPARFWEEAPGVLAGRDLSAGGTWLGMTRQGRFAALTNVREPGMPKGERSRGLLVSTYLLGDTAPQAYATQMAAEGAAYSGFNLLVGDADSLWWVSNRGEGPQRLGPGVHGLSNHLLNTPWPKVELARRGLQAQLPSPDPEALFALLADERRAADADLPQTGVGLDMERLLSAPFIRSSLYGTRSSTVLLAGHARIRFVEQTFVPTAPGERVSFAFDRLP